MYTSDAAIVLGRLLARGIAVMRDGDRLRCTPRAALTAEDLDALRSVKTELLVLLTGDIAEQARAHAAELVAQGDDSADWVRLLRLAYDVDPSTAGLYGVLHAFRCGGLRLERGGTGYRLRPTIGPDSVWACAEGYELDQNRYLRPHTAKLVRLLNRLLVG